MNHLNKIKSKLEQTLDELEDNLERERRSKQDVEKQRRKVREMTSLCSTWSRSSEECLYLFIVFEITIDYLTSNASSSEFVRRVKHN